MIYSQLRVSCGLSAIINALQPEQLKITPNQTFAHWLDIQWLKISNNNDPNNPLTQLCASREHKWVAVLDYILLRKIRSSFILCKGISPAALTTEADYKELNWNVLKKVFTVILDRLNNMKEDWPLWHYKGQLKNPQENLDDERFRKEALKLVQSIKVFYEIYQSNITIGLEADWKHAINSLGSKFPEEVTPEAVYNHLDYYKTDFELRGLLETLGYIPDYTYGMQYPQNVKPNSIVLINRPGHWVCEDCSSQASRGTILDSLTCSTDSIRMGDTFNYFKPANELRLFKKILPELAKIFPDVEIQIEEIEYVEFPPLQLPVTDDPIKTAQEYELKATTAYLQQNYKNALNFKRISCGLLEKTTKIEQYINCLIQFTQWCLLHDKLQTAKENIEKLKSLIDKYYPQEELKNILNKKPEILDTMISYYKMLAFHFNIHEDYKNAAKTLQTAFNTVKDINSKLINYSNLFDLSNLLGVAYTRLKNYNNALNSFKKAKDYALLALENQQDSIAEDEIGPPIKYWPALIKSIDNKLKELNELIQQEGLQKIS
ncbi:MAG: hypothetical protein ACTSRZ_07440 [Promethearchaeota archaeon]